MFISFTSCRDGGRSGTDSKEFTRPSQFLSDSQQKCAFEYQVWCFFCFWLVSMVLLVENTTKLYPGPTIQSRPSQIQSSMKIYMYIVWNCCLPIADFETTGVHVNHVDSVVMPSQNKPTAWILGRKSQQEKKTLLTFQIGKMWESAVLLSSDGCLQPLWWLASNHLLLHRLLKVRNHYYLPRPRLFDMKSYVSQADPDPPRFFLWMWTKLTIYKKTIFFINNCLDFIKNCPLLFIKNSMPPNSDL